MNTWVKAVKSKIVMNQQWIFLGLVICLILWGLAVLSEASFYYSLKIYKSPFFILVRQAVFIAQGILGFIIIQKMDLSRLLKWPFAWLAMAAILPLLAFAPIIGHEVHGATRWLIIPLPANARVVIHTGLFSLICFFIAVHIFNAVVRDWTRIEKVIVAFVFCWVAIWLLKQPDTVMFLLLGAFSIYYLFLAGRRKTALAMIMLFVCLVLSYYYFGPQYIRLRLTQFFDYSLSDATSNGYQMLQSRFAFWHGGWSSVGLENVFSSRLNLPGAHDEFIFAVLAEAYGLVGVAIYILAIVAFIYFGLTAARRISGGREAAVLKFFVILIAVYAFCSIGVTIHLLPVFAMPLPFFSSGGAFLLITLLTSGWIFKHLRGRAIAENKSYDIVHASAGVESAGYRLIWPLAITLSVAAILFLRAMHISYSYHPAFQYLLENPDVLIKMIIP